MSIQTLATCKNSMETFSRYSACGNRFIIYRLPDEGAVLELRSSAVLQRKLVKQWGADGIDSILVVSGNPHNYARVGYHLTMDVFEPHAFDGASPEHAWSTMCGNGVRAVALYLYENELRQERYKIRTGAGTQEIVRQGENWCVSMRYFTQRRKDLMRYVNRLPNPIDRNQIQFGFHFHNHSNIDGEPHAVIFVRPNLSINNIKARAQRHGRILTHDISRFPYEINTNVASFIRKDARYCEYHINAATYERCVYYVTESCGTGAAAVGALVFLSEQLDDKWSVLVHMPGGILRVQRNAQNQYFLIGPAQREA